MLEKEQDDDGRVTGPAQARPARPGSSSQDPEAPQAHQGRQAEQQHHTVAAGIAVTLEEGPLGNQRERQWDAKVVPGHTQARPKAKQEEQQRRNEPEPGARKRWGVIRSGGIA